MRFLLSCWFLLWTPALLAASPLDKVLQSNEAEFLPVEQAFVPSASLSGPRTVQVRFEIAEGYYLYRHQLRFLISEPAGFTLGEARLPAGKKKTDEYFGPIEAYYNRLEARLPITAAPKDSVGQTLTLELRFQGCADRGLCYPPETVLLPLLPDAAPASDPAETSPAAAEASDQGQLAQMMGERNFWLVVLSFFGFGLLLAFTPCVLPMLPILSGIIAGSAERESAWRGFTLAAAYVVAMALAYTVFGIVAGFTGANIQAAMQEPWVIIAFSSVFVMLALSMFDLFHLQLPSRLQSWISHHSNRQRGGSLIGAGIMGFLSALIVGPCIAPPLAGALLYISDTGDALLGGSALFALGMGMGVPLLALGAVEGGLLPRAGAWMTEVKRLFGLILLGVALWMMERILPGRLTTVLWALLALGAMIYLLITVRTNKQVLRYPFALLLLLYAALMLYGATRGSVDPLRPWQAFEARPGVPASRAAFLPVKTAAEVNLLLTEAGRKQQPAILDLYADWCVACVKMEHKVFGDPRVAAALEGVLLLRADVTGNDAEDRELLKTLGSYGPPTVAFFGPDGKERAELRLVGETDSAGFLERLQRLRR